MPDPVYADRRLARLYDPFDPDRGDLDVYAAMVGEFAVRSVLDLGCGTGTFACLLARRGVDVVGVDPAEASLAVAREKPFADRVRWIRADATTLPPLAVELVTMTANVAQVFRTDDEWHATLRGVHAALEPGGRLVFETRDPASEPWLAWSRDQTEGRADIPGVGPVRRWCDVLDVSEPFVTFRWTHVLESDGAVLVSDSTLRFRGRAEVEHSLRETGFVLDEVRDAPDRPGSELVFVATREAD